ncbi:unnamed protein product [Coccothraustes coccothraustes]
MKLLLGVLFLWLLSSEGNTDDQEEYEKLEALRSLQFSCEQAMFRETHSSSVHALRPADIKAVTAIGSLQRTPGPGEDLLQSTGKNFLEVSMATLAALISTFNPSVLHVSPPPGTAGETPDSQARDLLHQAEEIVQLMKVDQMMDFQNDWKLITVFFNAETSCSSYASTQLKDCISESLEKLTAVLDFLYEKVPKAFVNLVDSTELTTAPLACQDYSNARNQCNYVERSTLHDNILRWSYQDALEKLLESERFDQKDDFTVVLQPSVQGRNLLLGLGKDDLIATSNTQVEILEDCIFMAVGLWNSMMQPVGQKQPYGATKIVQCPSWENPYLFTYRNSNYSSSLRTSNRRETPQERIYGTNMPCPDRDPSDTVPVSVHNLKPADIRVIAALGDSLTAANGAGSRPHDVLDVLTQYRGLSWSVGGNENISTVTTLPNILREFNPTLVGYSIGTGRQNSNNASLNQAVAGARSEDVPEQVRKLVDRMKNDTRIDFQNDWKLITLFIGGNDLCKVCENPVHYSPENYTYNIQIALDLLHKEVPRAYVNLVTMLYIARLRELHQSKNNSCPKLAMRLLCPCVINPKNDSNELKKLIYFNRQYQEGTRRLVESGRYDTKDDFTVVMQPFMTNIEMPKTQEGWPDESFFAPDCFHFSQKAHSQAARALWNNMLEPVGEKTDSQKMDDELVLKCPSEAEPFLRTYKNSNYTYPNQTANYGSQLPCEDRSPSSPPATSVHSLKPADVKIVAALGDSLTAGSGIASDTLQDVITQYRGLSWSIGGDESLENVTTLPNILKKFNPNLFGFSTGSSKETAGFNVAERNASARDMPAQARALVELMRSSSKINFKEDWKLITILVGGSDLCQYCLDKETYSVQKYVKHLQDTLDIFYKELPRVFINVVEMLEFSGLRQITASSSECALTAKKVCPCLLNPEENSSELQEIRRVNRDFQAEALQLIHSGRYEQRQDFAAVIQPFFRNTLLPLDSTSRPDMSFFAADCFHFSARGYAEMAMALWNNMLEPVGEKQTYNNFTHDRSKLRCPNPEKPFLFTRRNSGFGNSDVNLEKTDSSVPYWAVIVTAVAGVLVGSLLGWVVSRRRIKKHQRKAGTENNMKTTPL